MHGARVRTLLLAVSAVLAGRRLVLMDLARWWPGADRMRAPLKRLDRLLGNAQLQAECRLLYGDMARWLIRQRRPVIVVDWSELQPNGRWHLLRAGIPVGGRTVTLIEAVHPERLKNSPRAEGQLLAQLRMLLPAEVTPILVTDAGFRAPWFRAVQRLGCDYVGRVRHRTRVQLEPDLPWIDNRQLHRLATPVPTRYDGARIVANRPWSCDLVFYRIAPQGRHGATKYGMPSRAHSGHSYKARGRAQDPWLLATSLPADLYDARQVVALYRVRMQIESSFRDLKCDRFGCGFSMSLTRSAERLTILLLLHALACFVAWLAAIAVRPQAAISHGGIARGRPRAHYSRLPIGWEALRRKNQDCSTRRLWLAFVHPPAWMILHSIYGAAP